MLLLNQQRTLEIHWPWLFYRVFHRLLFYIYWLWVSLRFPWITPPITMSVKSVISLFKYGLVMCMSFPWFKYGLVMRGTPWRSMNLRYPSLRYPSRRLGYLYFSVQLLHWNLLRLFYFFFWFISRWSHHQPVSVLCWTSIIALCLCWGTSIIIKIGRVTRYRITISRVAVASWWSLLTRRNTIITSRGWTWRDGWNHRPSSRSWFGAFSWATWTSWQLTSRLRII